MCCPYWHPEHGSRWIPRLTMDTLPPRWMPDMGRKRGLYPACLRIARREARGGKGLSSARVSLWLRLLGSCYDVDAAGLRRVVTGRRIERKGTARPGSLWATTLGSCYNWEAAGLRRVVTGRRIERRAQLDQGQYGASTLGKLRRREAASLRWKWQTSACRSCDLAVPATPQAKGDGQRAWGTPTVQ